MLESRFAAMARHFSYLTCPLRLGVRTPGFHLGNRGSNPLGDAIIFKPAQAGFFL